MTSNENEDSSSDTGGDGGWRDALPDSVNAAPFFRGADSLDAAIADLTRAAEGQGNSLRIPGPDADDAARAEFYDKIAASAPGVMRAPDQDDSAAIGAILTQLGKPAEANEYALTDVDGAPISDERAGELKKFAHEAGLTKSQFDKFMGQMLSQDATDVGATRTEHEKQIGELKGEWGSAYEQRMAKVAKMLEVTGAEPRLAQALTDGNLSAKEARWLHSLSERLGGGEGGAVGSQGKSEPEPVLTPHEALLRLNELEKGNIGVFMDPETQAAFTKKRMELMQLAKPNSSTDDSMLRRSLYGS